MIQSAFLRCRSERSRTYATLTHHPTCSSAMRRKLGASVGYRAPTIGGAMNEACGLAWLFSRVVKSDDNVGSSAMRERRQKAAYAGLL